MCAQLCTDQVVDDPEGHNCGPVKQDEIEIRSKQDANWKLTSIDESQLEVCKIITWNGRLINDSTKLSKMSKTKRIEDGGPARD